MRPQAADCGPSSSSRHLFASSVSQRSDASSRALVFGGGPGSGPRAAASDLSLWEGGGGEASVHALEAECLDSLQSSLRAVEKTNRAAQYTAEALNAQAGKFLEADRGLSWPFVEATWLSERRVEMAACLLQSSWEKYARPHRTSTRTSRPLATTSRAFLPSGVR